MTHPGAGTPAPANELVDVPALLARYEDAPDPAVVEQRVAFGTSGHRGSALTRSFNDAHIAAIAQDRLPANIEAVPGARLPAGATPRIFPGVTARCHVNPGIASVTLTKGSRRGQVSVSYEIVNQGRSAWSSGAD